ncbi:MAG: hypothetical protein ACREWG_04850 [Gammaproteobacteria bacterium]
MATPPSREQLAIAMGALSTESIRSKFQSGELTEQGQSVAEEELARRAREGEPPAEPQFSPALFDSTPVYNIFERPFGWSWGQWLAVVGFCFLVVISFGVTAKNAVDQVFLLAVILLQAIALAGILRAIAAIFFSSSALGVFGKLVAILALGAILFALTVCSVIAQHGWGGG